MGRQSTASSIAALLAMSLLASMNLCAPEKAQASQLPVQSSVLSRFVKDFRHRHERFVYAEPVQSERLNTATLQEDGRAPYSRDQAREVTLAGLRPFLSREDWLASRYSPFDSAISPARVSDKRDCDPSLATPLEIAHLVINAARRHKVNEEFAVAIAIAESRLGRSGGSAKGAHGPMQLMPETAERFGVMDVCDPAQNIEGGVRYLRELSDEFKNSLLVAAAYNAGEARVREYGGLPPFGATLGYVAEVLNIQLALRQSAPHAGSPLAEPQKLFNVSGVITSHERRRWIGGVMHF